MKKYSVTWFDSLMMKDVCDTFDTRKQAKEVASYRNKTRKWWHHPAKVEEIENGENKEIRLFRNGVSEEERPNQHP